MFLQGGMLCWQFVLRFVLVVLYYDVGEFVGYVVCFFGYFYGYFVGDGFVDFGYFVIWIGYYGRFVGIGLLVDFYGQW